MSEALYRGQSALGFGLWRLNDHGHWVFSMPVEGATWRRVEAPDLAHLVELSDRDRADAELIADTLSAARALATADLHPGDAVHDAANLQEMLAFVIAQLDQRLAAAEVTALRSAASDLEGGLDGINDANLQRAATAVAIAVGWLRRRADRFETTVAS